MLPVFGRTRIIAITVFTADPPIRTLDDKLTFLYEKREHDQMQ